MASTTLTVRGHKIRTQSHFRYQIVRLDTEKVYIVGRSDSYASARQRASNYAAQSGGTYVVVDRTTGEEV
jgi:hypothetical protein